ncbi:MAG TPA: fatty acid desaturase [Chthoniobacterales bacterium]|nr:fatty acid desaturase [Chthoniobacterales bacterium]
MIFRIPTHRINWTTSSFLIGTLILTLTAVPWYLLSFGVDWFHFAVAAALLAVTGFSITLGYHRLFSHATFRAKLPIRLFVVIFGAAAFENSVLMWASEHRRHHKHVDHEEDPYDITKGFFHAHIGWLLFKLWPQPPFDNVADLKKDPLVMWQHRHINLLAVLMGFALPTLIGACWDGWAGALGGFLIGGVAKIVVLQHCTFLINSACHTIGRQPYSTKCSARDSLLLAVFTFGEGYHNYHHEFQYDYRNGVKPWQWDPTKWLIWTLSKLGLTNSLRRVPAEAIHSKEAALRSGTQEAVPTAGHFAS